MHENISRKGFLKGAAAFGAALAVEAIRSNENLEWYSSNEFSVDFVPTSFVAALARIDIPYEIKDNQFVEQLLGSYYVPETSVFASALPGFMLETAKGFRHTLKQDPLYHAERFTKHALIKYPEAAAAHLLYSKMSDHGRLLTANRTANLMELGYRTDSNLMIPVQPHLHPVLNESGENALIYDDFFNPGFRFVADHIGIGQDCKRYSQNKRIMRACMHFGEIEAYSIFREVDPANPSAIIEVNPYIKIVDAYDESKAYNNLLRLVELVTSLDIDLAVIALSNDNGNINEAVAKLRKQRLWPETKILFGAEALPITVVETDEMGNKNYVVKYKSWRGAKGPLQDTIYVDTRRFHGYRASGATTVLGMIADLHSKNGVRGDMLKEKTLEASELLVDNKGGYMNIIRNIDHLKSSR